ncbi:T9SS type A sorting domain-containing protein [Aquimarina sp. 2201CG1-2-11]|uniref:T9SS type A sorting domain-containing protein n=1 Tax=Aquimarina discodermiae TaxID=3231043 RepID=UPI003462237F
MKKLVLFLWILTLSVYGLQAQCGPGQDTTPPVLGTTQDGTLSNPFRNLLPATVGSVPSGTYYFNFNGNTFQGVLDNDTDGGGWLMILNYVHLAGDNSALQVRNTDLPLLGSSTLGDDEAATANWGHMGNQLAAAIDFEEMRFYAETSGHSRVISFKTNYANAVNYVKTGIGSFSGLRGRFNILPGHTANIPGSSLNGFFSSKGDFALTDFPFYVGGTYHWGVRGLGNRWEVDDFGLNNNSTIHRVWVRGDASPFAPTSSLTVTLDTNGNATVDPTSFGYGATDNCGTANLSLSQANFDCSHIGANTIQLIATDAANNAASIDVTVTIVDSPPVITTDGSATIELDPITGMATLTLADLNASVADDCGSATLSLSKTNFTCEDTGISPIQLTATDDNGATSTRVVAVFVEDNTDPVIECVAPFTLELDATGTATLTQEDILTSFTDNCSISRVRISPSSFSCSDLGDNSISITVYDNGRNRVSCTTTVTITMPSCPGDLVLDADSNACGAVYNYPCASNITAGPASGTLLAVGSTTTFTYDIPDNNGGTSTCTYDVTVNDTMAPQFTTKDHTVMLDANGTATVDVNDLIGPDALARDYTVETTGTLDRVDISANGTQVVLDDDELTPALPIGFEFAFYGYLYTEFYISSNGFITFSDEGEDGCCNGQTLPDTSEPNNLIAFDWNDIDPESGGTMRYATIGDAPNRILIMDWDSVTHIDDSNDITTTQVKLFEGTNRIEIHTTNIPLTGDDKTQGLENIDGTAAIPVPGRNATQWGATNDYVAFIPTSAVAENCGIDTLEVTPSTFGWTSTGDNTVTITAIDVNGNTSIKTATVRVTADCPYMDLPDDNFQLQAFSETCVGKNNGNIQITASEHLNYIASINGETYPFNSNLTVGDLAPGTYMICITVDGTSDCEKCYEFTIDASSSLLGKITKSTSKNQIFIDIESGTAPYIVTVNDKEIGQYNSKSFTVDVKNEGVVNVFSKVTCQGKLSLVLDQLQNVAVYPNPTNANVTFSIPDVNSDTMTVEVHNALGVSVSLGVHPVIANKIELPMQSLSAGIYFITLNQDTSKTMRIIKK